MDGRVMTPIPCCVHSLPPLTSSVPVARSLVRGALTDWRLTGLEPGAALVVTELVSNAIRHGEDITLCLHLDGDRALTVEVWDSSPQPPVRRDPGPYDPRGRGLQLVDAYADVWGFRDRHDRGKIVWARLRAGRPAER